MEKAGFLWHWRDPSSDGLAPDQILIGGASHIYRPDRKENICLSTRVVGLSILSGAHMTLFPRVKALLAAAGREDVLLIGGGIIPRDDVSALEAQGVARLLGPGTSSADIVAYITTAVAQRQA